MAAMGTESQEVIWAAASAHANINAEGARQREGSRQ
jgi:hypothetical protein